MNITRLAFALLLALPLAADSLDEVRSALGRFTARDAIQATYELQQSVHSEGKFGNDKYDGRVSVEMEADASGVRVFYPRILIDHVDRERLNKARQPNLETPSTSAINEMRPAETYDAVDVAPTLIRLLDGAKTVSDAHGTWAGKPARVLVLKAAERLDDDDKGKVKMAENRITLWLGADMVPLAVEHLAHAKFSFLFFKGESKQKKSWHLMRAGDRLVRARYEYTETSSGMGQKGNESIVAVLRVK
jgi:hypothetical protein